MTTIRFGTLGPAGTNHEYVTNNYIKFHELDASVTLYADFDDAMDALDDNEIDYLVQCAVHPDTPRVMGSNFRERFVVDAFISPSQTLAILTRQDIAAPRSICLVSPATDDYADLSNYDQRIPTVSIPYAFDRLLNGECDSALVYRHFADLASDRVRVDVVIGSPDDAWIVYGHSRVGGNGIVSDRTSPVATQYAAVQRSRE